MKLFTDLSNWFKILWLFLKFTWENFVKFLFSYFSQLLLLPSFFNKGNSGEIENSLLKNLKNVNTWLSWWRHQMMTKVTSVSFFIKAYSILSIQYKISCKMDKIFLRYMFFHNFYASTWCLIDKSKSCLIQEINQFLIFQVI